MTPDEFTNQELKLPVGDGHELYVQDWGNPQAKTPILFLHGGPGSGSSDRYKVYFNPAKHRVIFHDQRGSGKSLPSGSLEHNKTADLVSDIDKILTHFNPQQVILCGRSWGSTLALAYAVKNPKRVKSMVLGGIFTGAQDEIDWLNKGIFARFFPETWNWVVEQTPVKYREDPVKYHTEEMLKGGPEARRHAYIIGTMEQALLHLDERFSPRPFDDEYDPTSTKIENYYMSNGCFMPDRYILGKAHKLTMPIWLVQGRYDMVCPPAAAYELKQKMPDCQLIWTQAGHSGNDRENWLATKTILSQLVS